MGGVPQSFTLLSEFSPKKHRARVFSLLSLFGPVGTCLTVRDHLEHASKDILASEVVLIIF